jgi:arabinofuranosyltransferase
MGTGTEVVTTVDSAQGSAATSRRLPRGRDGVQWLLVAGPVLVLVAMGWQHRWMSDDGFIHLRVVEQITGGHGAVLNVGERVEASTSPLWVVILAFADLVGGIALPWKAVLLGIVLSGAGLLLAQRAGIVLARSGGDMRTVVPLGALVVAALPPFWDYATSGLETGLIFAWLGGSQWWCARRVAAGHDVRLRADLLGAMGLGLGYLIRPDLALFTLALGGVTLAAAARQGARRVIAVTGAMVALPLGYQVFRMGYYALLVPNTALAKEAGRSQWGQGWRYLADLAVPYGLWLPIVVVAAVVARQATVDWRTGARLRSACRLAPVAAAGLQTIYVVRVGGDFMHARMLLPALFALLAPVGVPLTVEDVRRLPRQGVARAAAVGLVGTWAVVCAVALPRAGTVPRVPDGTIEDERLVWGAEVRLDLLASDVPEPTRGAILVLDPGSLDLVAVPLRPGVPVAAASVPAGGMGRAYAWDLDVYTVELGSLAHPVGSHFDVLVGRRPGHQKQLPPVWQVAGLAEGPSVRGPDGEILVSDGDLRAAEATLRCGQLATYLEGIREPLTPGQFLHNIGNSLANTRLRLPRDPHVAEHRMCGNADAR